MGDLYCDRPMTEADAAWHEDTFAGRMEALEREAYRLGAWGVIAQADQVRAHLAFQRDERLFGADR